MQPREPKSLEKQSSIFFQSQEAHKKDRSTECRVSSRTKFIINKGSYNKGTVQLVFQTTFLFAAREINLSSSRSSKQKRHYYDFGSTSVTKKNPEKFGCDIINKIRHS